MEIVIYIIGFIVTAILAYIPANMAKNKGYNFWLWWLYGCMFFIVAIVHVNAIPSKKGLETPAGLNVADELKKYKELYDQGVITIEEFQQKKEQLFNLDK